MLFSATYAGRFLPVRSVCRGDWARQRKRMSMRGWRLTWSLYGLSYTACRLQYVVCSVGVDVSKPVLPVFLGVVTGQSVGDGYTGIHPPHLLAA